MVNTSVDVMKEFKIKLIVITRNKPINQFQKPISNIYYLIIAKKNTIICLETVNGQEQILVSHFEIITNNTTFMQIEDD